MVVVGSSTSFSTTSRVNNTDSDICTYVQPLMLHLYFMYSFLMYPLLLLLFHDLKLISVIQALRDLWNPTFDPFYI